MSSHEDCEFWALTPRQCVRYHLRLSGYHQERSLRFSAEAVRYADLSAKAFGVALALAAVSGLLILVGGVLSAS